jgi:hypothetical protein
MHGHFTRQVFRQSFQVRLLYQRLYRERPRYGLNFFFLMQRVELLFLLLNLRGNLLR